MRRGGYPDALYPPNSRYHTHTILLCHALCSTIPCPCSLMAYTIQHTMLWGVGALGMECTAHPLCSISRLHIPEYIYRCIHLSRDVYTYIILSIPLHAVPGVSCPSCVYIICLHIHTPSWCIYVAMLCVCVAGHPLVRRLRLYPDMCSRSGGARQSLGIAIPSSRLGVHTLHSYSSSIPSWYPSVPSQVHHIYHVLL